MSVADGDCQYCGNEHATMCPRIKALEFAEDGVTVRRVEFFAPNEYSPVSYPPTDDGRRYAGVSPRDLFGTVENPKRLLGAEDWRHG